MQDKNTERQDFILKYSEFIAGIAAAAIVLAGLTTYSNYSGQHISLTEHILYEAGFGTLVTLFLKMREGSIKSLKKLHTSTEQIQHSLDVKANAALLSQDITKNYYEIISYPYNSLVNEYIKEVQKDQKDQSLIALVQNISELRKKRILVEDEFWRIVADRIAYSHQQSIASNNYILSLETYCKLLIDFLKVGQKIGDSNKKTLVVISFTSVTPKDWFSEREVIGNPLRDYASQMKGVINEMRENYHIFRRLVVCKNDELNKEEVEKDIKDTMFGFSLLSQVKHDWAARLPKEKETYLKDYHSDVTLAEILSFNLPHLKFYNNCNEFVFVGYKDKPHPENEITEQSLKNVLDIKWDWCFCLGYTENNINVSASFINLRNSSNTDKNIIDIPNELDLLEENSMVHRKRLQITFKDFPNFVFNNSERFSSITQFNNLIPLAEKWEIASEIWHSEDEAELLKIFFKKQIPANKKILDAACGTGQHFFILHSMSDMNYRLTASDNDDGNLEIFKRKAANMGLTLNPLKADWNTLSTTLTETFDVINCIGTSIPYYKSWKEKDNGYSFNEQEIHDILLQFKKSLNPDGKLIIGLSRYINKNLTETYLKFQPKRITNSLIGIQDSDYTMSWYFSYDWSDEKRKRIWICHIKNKEGDDYSFTLVSHLFDIRELELYCQKVFGDANVEFVDIESSSYDMFLICTNKKQDATVDN